MSTLAEIEAAVSALTLDELRRLERLLQKLTKRSHSTRAFTGREAINWWCDSEHLGAAEADSFAADLEAALVEIEAPASRWD